MPRSLPKSDRGIVVHSLHKSATMFLFKFYRRIAKDCGCPFYSINNDPADHVQDWSNRDQRFILCPERSFDFSAGNRNRDDDWRVIQIRDPRDILVSEYFSVGWIHAIEDESLANRREQTQQMSIDEYVLNPPRDGVASLLKLLEPLREFDVQESNSVVLKYESMITDLPAWTLRAIRPFGFRFPRLKARKYTRVFQPDFRGKQESLKHKRKMTPGDHREKLQPATIERLNQQYDWFLRKFGYPLS